MMDTPLLNEGVVDQYQQEAIGVLKDLIKCPSPSKEEGGTAQIIQDRLDIKGIQTLRKGNNVYARNRHFDEQKPTVLLNSHHDTVKPNEGYMRDPFHPVIEDDKLFGLGSNDAGGCLVSLMITFLHFYEKELPYNLVLAATAEEEISGQGGVVSILKELGPIEFGIVGEPTEMKAAVAEKGLMVLDCYEKGEAGHAAYDVGINAIYRAMEDIQWFRNHTFDKVSPFLGKTRMTVTQIESGIHHNMNPDRCHFVVDVRATEMYTFEEILNTVRTHVSAGIVPRSTRLKPSLLTENLLISHVIRQLGIKTYGSSTLSDQALMPFPTCKMGPGISQRSHTADEFIRLSEVRSGIIGYITLLHHLFNQKRKHEALAKEQ